MRRCRLNVAALYQRDGEYEYYRGWNPYAILALILGIAPSLPGFLTAINVIDDAPQFLVQLYDYAWFVGAFTSAATYYLFMRMRGGAVGA